MKMSYAPSYQATARWALGLLFSLSCFLCFPMDLWAGEIGRALPGQIELTPGVTPVWEEMHFFYTKLLVPIISAVCVFVLILLGIVVFKFNERKNPVPSHFTHNVVLEIGWTIVPVLILVVIAIPSFHLLAQQVSLPAADMIVKATGKQWYWSYEYLPKDGGMKFDSVLKADKDIDLSKGDIRLLSVDNELVVPVNKVIHVEVTAADVIHSFAVTSLAIRIDAVPGRLNQTWFKAEKEGIYYGQCSKLCGKDHAFMPIAIRVVNEQDYQKWLEEAKKKFL